jgi:hypothetical protein
LKEKSASSILGNVPAKNKTQIRKDAITIKFKKYCQLLLSDAIDGTYAFFIDGQIQDSPLTRLGNDSTSSDIMACPVRTV